MSSSNSSLETTQYYVRAKGKILGPFGIEALKSLRDRGRLSRVHEISTDRHTWQPAARFEQLFSTTRSARPSRAAVENTAEQSNAALQHEPATATPAPQADWFYSIDGRQQGPVSFAELKRLAHTFQLSGYDLVWKEGMRDWKPAGDIDGLFEGTAFKKSSRSTAATSAGTSTTADPVRRPASIWDAVLDGVQLQFPVRSLDLLMDTIITAGSIGVVVTMLIVPGFIIYTGIKEDSLNLVILGVLSLLTLGILRYAGERVSRAAQAIIASSPSQLSSDSYLRGTALFQLLLGIVFATVFSVIAVQEEESSLYVFAVVTFTICGFNACAALQPAWLNIECPASVTAGEEGIGILSLTFKLTLRAIGAAYGIGCFLGMIGLLIGGGMYKFREGIKSLEGMGIATVSAALVAGAAFLPLVAYRLVTIGYILIDVLRSVMLIPGKLDVLAANTASSPAESDETAAG